MTPYKIPQPTDSPYSPPPDYYESDDSVRDSLVQKLYSVREKKPELDEAKVERLRRMGRINTLGRVGNVIGDALSVAVGGTVKRRQPDQIAPMLYQSYENMLDRYENQKDAYDYRSFQTDRQNLQLELANDDYKKEKGYRNKVRADDSAYRGARAEAQEAANRIKMEQEKLKQENDKLYKNEVLRLRGKGLTIQEAHYKAQELIDQSKVDKMGETNKNYVLRDNAGNPVRELQQGDEERLLNIILKDPSTKKAATSDINYLKAQFGEGLSAQGIKNIISWYWDKSEEAKKYVSGQSYTSQSGTASQDQPVETMFPQNEGQETEGTEEEPTLEDFEKAYRRNQ